MFITTTLVLAEQAKQEFLDKCPNIPVGILTGDEKELPESGILVTTYQMLHALKAQGTFPQTLKDAALVFADEAHHAMTAKRSGLLRDIFSPFAVRIALTATPDYDELRTLANVFPNLIHEMTIQEGVRLGLLAKTHAFTVPVDIGKADVHIVGGDYDQGTLGDFLSHASLLKAATMARYDLLFRSLPALVSCSSRAQAEIVCTWMSQHSPDGSPEPCLVLGNTNPQQRKRLLTEYDEGTRDTIINVGVLIEGWNAPRCKLLIDLAPSLSLVRSAQKYARVMTKNGEQEANIVVLFPHNLIRQPILPMEVFGPGIDASWERIVEHETEIHTVKKRERPHLLRRMHDAGIRVLISEASVDWEKMYTVDGSPTTMTGKADMRNIVRSSGFLSSFHLGFRGYGQFLNTRFVLDRIMVRGSGLLHLCGHEVSLRGYQDFLMTYFPDEVTDILLTGNSTDYYARRWNMDAQKLTCMEMPLTVREAEESCAEQFQREFYRHDFATPLDRKDVCKNDDGWIAASGGTPTRPADELIETMTIIQLIDSILQDKKGPLTPMEGRMIHLYYGIDEEPCTLSTVGDAYGLSRERTRQLIIQTLTKIQKWLRT